VNDALSRRVKYIRGVNKAVLLRVSWRSADGQSSRTSSLRMRRSTESTDCQLVIEVAELNCRCRRDTRFLVAGRSPHYVTKIDRDTSSCITKPTALPFYTQHIHTYKQSCLKILWIPTLVVTPRARKLHQVHEPISREDANNTSS
jgi:hypothetical protein